MAPSMSQAWWEDARVFFMRHLVVACGWFGRGVGIVGGGGSNGAVSLADMAPLESMASEPVSRWADTAHPDGRRLGEAVAGLNQILALQEL